MIIMSSPRQDSNLRQRLYKSRALPTELQGQAPQPGFEPGTNRLTVDSSTAELLWNGLKNKSPTGTAGLEPAINILEG